MTLVQLQHFVALARAGSFVKASALVHVTQPALSRSIAGLEDELGQRLFDRLGRRIELTPFGHDTLRRAQFLIEDARELRNSGRQLASGARGRIRLGLSSGPGALLTTGLLTHMAKEFPAFHIEISRGHTETLVQLLRERSLDAMVVDVRSLKPSPDLQVLDVMEIEAAFMCRPGHPLARRKKVEMAQLQAFPMASTPLSDEVARMLVEQYGESAHPQEMVTLCSDEIAHLIEVVLQSDALLLAVRACAPQLLALPLQPTMKARARYGMVTVAGRAQSVFLPEIRRQVARILGATAAP